MSHWTSLGKISSRRKALPGGDIVWWQTLHSTRFETVLPEVAYYSNTISLAGKHRICLEGNHPYPRWMVCWHWWGKQCETRICGRTCQGPHRGLFLVVVFSTADTILTYFFLKKVTLHVISSAGFGHRMSWRSSHSPVQSPDSRSSDQHISSFQVALRSCLDMLLLKVIVPSWMYAVTEKIPIPVFSVALRHIKGSFDSLSDHLMEMISSSRASASTGGDAGSSGAALLRNLVEANMNLHETDVDEKKGKQLTDMELISDIFVSHSISPCQTNFTLNTTNADFFLCRTWYAWCWLRMISSLNIFAFWIDRD